MVSGDGVEPSPKLSQSFMHAGYTTTADKDFLETRGLKFSAPSIGLAASTEVPYFRRACNGWNYHSLHPNRRRAAQTEAIPSLSGIPWPEIN